MRFLKNHPWAQPGDDEPGGVDWNFWKVRQPPFNRLEAGDTIWLAFGDTRAGMSRIEWEVEVRKVVTARYTTLREAWRTLVGHFPELADLTWRRFRADEYSQRAPDSGWLLVFSYQPVRHLGIPRAPQLRFRPNGWLPLDHLSDAELRSLGLLDSRSPRAAKGRPQRVGAGHMLDQASRQAVEKRAMDACRAHLRALGWSDHEIEDTHANRSYDFECRRGGRKPLRVEVKGTTGQLGHVELTRREVEHAQTADTDLALFVLSGVTLTASRSGRPVAKAGTPHCWHPWTISDGHLAPSRFDYTPPVQ